MNIQFVDLKAQYETIKRDIDSVIRDVITETAFIGGQHVSKFEESFASFCGVKHCVGVGNGTDAIFIALKTLGIGSGDYTAVAAAYTPPDPWFADTGFTGSSVLRGLVGYEYDSLAEGCVTPSPTVLFRYAARGNPNADAVRSIAPSGARIFASGSIRFATGLDPLGGRGDPRLRRFMRNALADLTTRH